MKKKNSDSVQDQNKASTGITGFDEITRGGLSRGRTTLLEGGPGSGKSILALRSLVNGAREFNEPGTLRGEKERAETDAQAEAEKAIRRQRITIKNERAELEARIRSMQRELELKNAEKDSLAEAEMQSEKERITREGLLRGLRKSDAVHSSEK
jgi:KaiC/GvpD/RAD55 family RecA-like ATPase